jgi:hypothetical protein
MTRGKSTHLLHLLLQILLAIANNALLLHLVKFNITHKIFSNMASNKGIAKWLFRNADAIHQSFQGVVDEANSHDMLNFTSRAIDYYASVESITSNISGRQDAAAAITAEIAPTAIDHANQASHDGDAVAVVQSAAISTEHAPTNGDAAAVTQLQGRTEAASAEGPSGLKETHAKEEGEEKPSGDAQEAEANRAHAERRTTMPRTSPQISAKRKSAEDKAKLTASFVAIGKTGPKTEEVNEAPAATVGPTDNDHHRADTIKKHGIQGVASLVKNKCVLPSLLLTPYSARHASKHPKAGRRLHKRMLTAQ